MNNFSPACFGLIALVSLLALAVLQAVTFAIGRKIGRYNVVDVTWGIGFVVVAAVAAILGDGDSSRRWLLLVLAAIWGLRLAWHVHRKSVGKGEDPRYRDLLDRPGGGPGTIVRKIFLTQAAAQWFVSLPLQVSAAAGPTTGPWRFVFVAGLVVWFVGLLFEAIGDEQLNRFKADPANKGTIMDRGLWSWTRHPNYFGDACVWWGVWLIAASAWPGVLTILSPIVMTYFLIFATGARLLEKSMSKRPGYPEYQERTSYFFPLPPKGAEQKFTCDWMLSMSQWGAALVIDDQRRWAARVIAIVVAFVAAATMLSVAQVPRAAAEPAPPADAFYDRPSDLASFAAGDIIRSRPVPVKAFQLFPIRVQAWQLLYRTADANGAPDAAVTTVMIPEGPAKPRPLLSYQGATDSTLRICNPSYGLVNGLPIDFSSPAGPITLPVPAAEIAFAAGGLAEGWAVAMPDHGGIDNRFLTPRQPGFAVLDGIRAAENFGPLGLSGAATPTALWGYSGGAIASSLAVEEQPTYAPELNIKGAAFGAPERDLEASLRSVNGALLGGLIPLALSAIGKDSPEFETELAKYLTPQGKAVIDETRNHCASQNVLSNIWIRYENFLTAPIDVVLANPVLRREIDARGVTDRTPTAPVYVYNGVTEEVAPIVGTDKLVNGYCARGAAVTYRREELPPNPAPQIFTTHGTVVATGGPAAFKWLKERLAPGAPTPSGCDIRTVPSTLLEPGVAAELPPFVATALSMIIGLPIGSGR